MNINEMVHNKIAMVRSHNDGKGRFATVRNSRKESTPSHWLACVGHPQQYNF